MPPEEQRPASGGGAPNVPADVGETDGANVAPPAPPAPTLSTPRPSTDLLHTEAVKALSRGWALTPLVGKRPILSEWQRQPPASPAEISKWVDQRHNLGLRTGRSSGVIVIDDDTEDCSAAAALGLPPTATVITGSGKRHYYFRCPPISIGNSTSRLLKDVDVRGEGGQVVFPGSVHPETGQLYRWLEGNSPEEIELAELPRHIVEALRAAEKPAPIPAPSAPPAAPPAPPPPKVGKYVAGVLRKSVGRVASADVGARNNILNKEAFNLGNYVGAGLIDEGEAQTKLLSAARTAGLPEGEALATIASGLGAGSKKPVDVQALTLKAQGRKKAGGAVLQVPPVQPPLNGQQAQQAQSGGRARIVYQVHGEDVPLHQLVPAALAALASRCADVLYARGERLVRVTKEAAPASHRVERRAALRIRGVPEAILRELLDSAAAWIAVVETKRGASQSVEKWAPRPVVAAVGEHCEFPGLRSLAGVVEAPTMRPDGSVLDKAGYDEVTALLYQPALDYPPIAEQPSSDEVRRAWKELLEPFREFPLESLADFASLAAFMLTIAGRAAIDGPVPHWAALAPTFGAGKTLLVEAAGMAMTGVAPDLMAPVGGRGGDAESEMRKRLTTLVLEAPRVAVIDNLPDGGTFESKAFAALLTMDRWTDRLLSKNEKVDLPHRIVWATTGCNIRLWSDLARRSLSILIDPHVEHPNMREFRIEDLGAYVRREHPRLLAAALTVLRGFVEAGRPPHGRPLLGKFEAWDRLVRAAVLWASSLCGEALDPLDTAARLQEAAPDRDGLAELGAAWGAAFGEVPTTAKEAVAAAQKDVRLGEAILGVGGANKGEPDARKLGNRLRVLRGRVVDGMVFRQEGLRQGSALWRRLPVESRPPRGSLGSGGSAEETTSSAPAPAPAREDGGGTLTRVTTDPCTPEPAPAEEGEVPAPRAFESDGYEVAERIAVQEEGGGEARGRPPNAPSGKSGGIDGSLEPTEGEWRESIPAPEVSP